MKSFTIIIYSFVIGVCLFNVSCKTKTDQGYRITIVTKALDSEFWQLLKQGAEDEANKHIDASVTVLAPQREINIDQQVNILEAQILKRVSALVVAPCGVAEIIPALDKAYKKNIPVLTVDTDVDWPHRLSYVGTNNRMGGKLAGEYLVKVMNGAGKIAIIRGIPGVQTHEDRVGGFLDVLKATPGIEIVALQPANSERGLALTVMENLLTSHPNLTGVFITSDQMTLGAMEAIDAYRDVENFVTVGFDAGEEIISALKEGKLTAAVAQNPYNMGKQSFLAALKAAKGEIINNRIDTGTLLIDKSNVNDIN
jgi:ribose transport system substrate-binding protein